MGFIFGEEDDYIYIEEKQSGYLFSAINKDNTALGYQIKVILVSLKQLKQIECPKVLLIGVAGGTIATAIKDINPKAIITGVDLMDCSPFINYFNSPLDNLIVMDAFEFIKECNDTYDIIISDVMFSSNDLEESYSLEIKVHSEDNHKHIMKLLNDKGVYIICEEQVEWLHNITKDINQYNKVFDFSKKSGGIVLQTGTLYKTIDELYKPRMPKSYIEDYVDCINVFTKGYTFSKRELQNILIEIFLTDIKKYIEYLEVFYSLEYIHSVDDILILSYDKKNKLDKDFKKLVKEQYASK